jgi:hypothetical protein
MTTVLEATADLKDSGKQTPLAYKMPNPKTHRVPESDVLRFIQAIALIKALEMRDHLPEQYFSSDRRAGNTLHTRSRLVVNGKGSRAP